MTEIDELPSAIKSRSSFHRDFSQSLNNLSMPPIGSGSTVFHRIRREVSTGMMGQPASGIGGSVTQQMRDVREREKMEMQHLNDKLAAFIEKVRFLDAQNRILLAEKEKLEGCNEKQRTSHVMYESEITKRQKKIDESPKITEEDLKKLEEKLTDLKEKLTAAQDGRGEDRESIDKLLVELSELESEINILKRRIALLEDSNDQLKKDNNDVDNLLTSTRYRIDHENILCLQQKVELEAAKERLKFETESYNDELQSLLAQAARDTTDENKEYFRNELSNAMRDLRNEHDKTASTQRHEMESMLQIKVHEIETQAAKQNIDRNRLQDDLKIARDQLNILRNRVTEQEGRSALLNKQIEQLKIQIEDDQQRYEGELIDKDKQIHQAQDEYESNMLEYQMMLDNETSLKNELACLRELLEGEDAPGLKQLVENVVKTTTMNEVIDTETMRVVKGESTSRSTNSRSAKGNVSIKEVCPSAAYIIVENTHKSKDEKIGGWKLKRKIDGKSEVVYTFPDDYILSGGSSVKVATKAAHVDENENILHFDGSSFGSGSSMYTSLYNVAGEERATLVQRQVASEVRDEVSA